MALKTLLSALCILAAIVPHTAAIGLEIAISESIDGYVPWFTLSDGAVQKFSLRWENTGSVNCLVRPRIDIFSREGNASIGNRVYTAWGSEEAVMAGASREWALYAALQPGNYAAVLRVYHCNEISEEKPYPFSVRKSAEKNNISISRIDVHDGYMDVYVKSSYTSDGIVVVPEEYPSGWIFESGSAGMVGSGDTARVRLGFVPVRTEGASVTLKAVSLEGSSSSRTFSVSSAKKEGSIPWGAAAALIVIFIFVLYVSRNIIKIWRR